METTIEIRKRIHEFVDKADERVLRIIHAIIAIEEDPQPAVPESLYKELDLEREQHIKGKAPSYSWEEVKSRLIKVYGL